MNQLKQARKYRFTKKEPTPQPRETKEKVFLSPWYVLLFPLLILYYEFIFKLTGAGSVFNSGTVVLLLFSIAYGTFLFFPLSFIKNRTALYLTTLFLMIFGAVLYLIQNLVYLQFKVYYDINTIFFGGADALSSYTKELFALIFSPEGLLRIFLFLLPAILYAIFGKKLFPIPEKNRSQRWLSPFYTILCFSGACLLILTVDPLTALYKTEYNYQSAVENFGLISSLGIDLKHTLSPGEEEDFTFEPAPSIPVIDNAENKTEEKEDEEEKETVTSEAKPIEYGYNQMELDLSGGKGEIASLNSYVNSLTPSKKNQYTGLFQEKNLIFITAEAFTKEVIDPELTPTLYRLATKGIQFTDYYQPTSSGTTGGEYQNVFGMLPTAGGASFKNTAKHYNYMTIGSQLNRLGYYGKAFHNNSHTYYSRNLTHNNLGYSDGFMGYGNGMEAYVKKAWPQSDLEMFRGTVPTYIDKELFNVYYMTVSGHSGYSKGGNNQTAKNWESVAHLPYSNTVKGYLAANLELEKALTYLVSELEAKGKADDTVICLATDHFPYGLDSNGKLGNMPYLSELYNFKVENYFQRDHSALILWCGSLEKEEPIVVDTPTFSLDILPTLSNLFGTEFDSRLFPGRDVFSDAPALVFNTNYDWKTEYGTYYASKNSFVPADDSITLPEGYVENMKGIVRNKMLYCRMALNNDYFRHLFKK